MAGQSKTGRTLSEAWTGFSVSLREAGRDAQLRLVAGIFGSLIVLTVLAGAGTVWLASVVGDGPLPGDTWAMSRVEGLLSVKAAVWIGQFGSSALLVPMILTAAILAARSEKAAHTLAISVGFVGSKIIAKASWIAWDRTRPGEVLQGALVPDKPSFPSGHVIQAMVVYGLLAVWWASGSARGWERVTAWTVAAMLILAVGIARVRTGAHWASDCWVAIVVGSVWLAAVVWSQRGFEEGPGRG